MFHLFKLPSITGSPTQRTGLLREERQGGENVSNLKEVESSAVVREASGETCLLLLLSLTIATFVVVVVGVW